MLPAPGAGPKTGFTARMVGAKQFNEPALLLRDENRLSVIAAKGEVGRFPGIERDLPLQFPLRAQHRDGAFAYSRHKQISFRVGAQAVDVKIVKPLQESGREKMCAVDPVRPYLPRIGFADIEDLAVRAEIDPVGRAHPAIGGHLFTDDLAVG